MNNQSTNGDIPLSAISRQMKTLHVTITKCAYMKFVEKQLDSLLGTLLLTIYRRHDAAAILKTPPDNVECCKL